MDFPPGKGGDGAASVNATTASGISKALEEKLIASIAANFKVNVMPDGDFAPYALTWSLFGPVSETPATCINLKNNRVKQESTPSATKGTHLESRPSS